MNLIELVKLSNDVRLSLVESAGEITEDTEKALAVLESNLPAKVDGYKYLYDDMLAEAQKFKDKAAVFAKIAKSFEGYADNLKERLVLACGAMGVTELVGNDYKWKLQKAKEKVVIDNEAEISGLFKTIVQTTQVDKDKILKHIKDGRVVVGAHLEQTSFVKSYPLGVKK